MMRQEIKFLSDGSSLNLNEYNPTSIVVPALISRSMMDIVDLFEFAWVNEFYPYGLDGEDFLPERIKRVKADNFLPIRGGSGKLYSVEMHCYERLFWTKYDRALMKQWCSSMVKCICSDLLFYAKDLDEMAFMSPSLNLVSGAISPSPDVLLSNWGIYDDATEDSVSFTVKFRLIYGGV